MATAAPRHIFGLRHDVRGNVAYYDEQMVVYPSGTNCVLYNMEQKSQKFIQASDKSRGLTAMAVSPNRRYVAVAERGDREKSEKPIVTVYDLHSLRRRKILSYADATSEEFVALAFSPDSKYLATQGGAPDWTLLYWTWEKSKVLASMKTGSPQGGAAVNQVTFNPMDNTQLSVVGSGIFRLLRYSEGSIKQFASQKMEPLNYLSEAWLSDERVVIGTETGRLFLFESGEMKMEFNLANGSQRRKESGGRRDTSALESSSELDLSSASKAITAIAPYSKGFVCSCGPGKVHVFEKTDDRELYKKLREISVPVDPSNTDVEKVQQLMITCLTISPSEETLVCSTDNGQLFSFILSSSDLANKNDHGQFEVLSQSFHSSSVTGLDVSFRKPLIATCSADKSVRIWNFETCSLEMYKEFGEEAYSVAFHPSGLYILVGFSDKLRLMNILIDDIRPFKEFSIRGCRECCFSHGGQFFVAVNGPVIQLFSTVTFENISNFKGHNGKINGVQWSADDTRLVSCGSEGAVYEWDVLGAKRVGENVLKACCYTGLSLAPDGKTSYAVGSDRMLKEFCDSQLLRAVDSADVVLTSVVLSHSGRMLFAGTSAGTVRSFKFPLTVPGEWVEYQAHGAAITKITVTHDDQYMITVSEDACVLIWKIQDRDGRGVPKREIIYSDEILITKSDLEEKNTMMSELKTRVEELHMENNYQLRLKDMNYNEKIKELTEKFIQEMESLKTKNQVLKAEKEKEESKHFEELEELKERQSRELQDSESTNNQKLMLEYEKFQELQGKSQRMQEDYERQLAQLEQKKEQALQTLTEFYEAKLSDLTTKLDQVKDEAKQRFHEYEETKRQMEEDADGEILGMRTRFELRLKDEQELNQKLKGETGIMRKKFTSLQKEIDEHKDDIRKNQNEIAKLNNIIRNLEKDILGLKKEIQERDETIQDKERRIYDLKKKNQELEKFKFVLDYKIKELKKQIEPREEEIRRMKEQIQEMESELDRFHKQNSQLELNIEELRQKLKSTEKEMHKEQQKVHDVKAMVQRYKTDLHNCVGYIQEPKLLKDSIKALYQKHVHEDITETAGLDADIQREFGRQREHLEKSVASLRKKLAKDSDIHKADNVRVMQENVSLIREINDLRRELKLSRTQIHDLEAALGLHRKNNETSAAVTLAQMSSTTKNAWMEQELKEQRKVVELQQSEIYKLRTEISDIEKVSLSRPSSSGRLPPVVTA